MKELFLIFILLAFFYTVFSKEPLEDTPLKGMNAQEACRHISSRAEEIEAEWGGIANVSAELGKNNPFGWMNPQNWKSGENESKQITKNIVENDLSTEDRTKIEESCNPISTSIQRNILDVNFDNCSYCDKILDVKANLLEQGKDASSISQCEIKNIKQSNINKANQTCQIQTAIEMLREKKNSVDSQALSEVLQKAQGLLSGDNSSSSNNCNFVSTDMSSKDYFEKISKCSMESQVDQENRIEGCAPIMNIMQENYNESFQQCLFDSQKKSKDKVDSGTKVTTKSTVEQITEGVTPMSSASSLMVSCVVCSVSIAAAFAFGFVDVEK